MIKDTGRIEAFSDGVIAIIITIMVLELDVPDSANFAALRPVLPVFLSYILSFVHVGIYWNNHHHLFKITENVSGGILWANLAVLFWLSLMPFVTAWMGENSFASMPAAAYGCVLLLTALSWWNMQRLILKNHNEGSLLVRAMGNSFKEKISPVLYILAIVLAFVQPWISYVLYGIVALIWVIPDRRVERALAAKQQE